MRAVVQRVRHAQVHVDGALIGECGPGVMILVCAMQGDRTDNANALVDKIAKLRIFKDDAGKMNRSLLDVEGSALVISQFTLAADGPQDAGDDQGPGGRCCDPRLGNGFGACNARECRRYHRRGRYV